MSPPFCVFIRIVVFECLHCDILSTFPVALFMRFVKKLSAVFYGHTSKFPCLGAVDDSHNATGYFNQKKLPSIVLLAMVDHA